MNWRTSFKWIKREHFCQNGREKIKHEEWLAKDIQARNPRATAYKCRLCNWWHTGSGIKPKRIYNIDLDLELGERAKFHLLKENDFA